MKTYLAMGWLFLVGLAVSLICSAVMIANGLDGEKSVAFLKSVGTMYSVPLGIMIALIFGKRTLLPTIGRGPAALSLGVVALWALLPAALGLYGAIPLWDRHAVGDLAARLEVASLPMNAAVAALLVAVFPDKEHKISETSEATPVMSIDVV